MAKLIIIHASEIPGGPDKDGRPQIIDAQCIWKNLPHTKEFLEEFKKFSDEEPKVYPKPEETATPQTTPIPSPSPAVMSKFELPVPPKVIERDPLVCEKLTPVPIRLPEFSPILNQALRRAPPGSPLLPIPSGDTVLENGLKNSDYQYSTEEKTKIIDELPKLDMGMCHWGCENKITGHAILWNISAIVESFKKTQNLKHAKILRTKILTDNKAPSPMYDFLLLMAEIMLSKEELEASFIMVSPEAIERLRLKIINSKRDVDYHGLSIPNADVNYFFVYILPYISVEKVRKRDLSRGTHHIDYRYDFD